MEGRPVVPVGVGGGEGRVEVAAFAVFMGAVVTVGTDALVERLLVGVKSAKTDGEEQQS